MSEPILGLELEDAPASPALTNLFIFTLSEPILGLEPEDARASTSVHGTYEPFCFNLLMSKPIQGHEPFSNSCHF